MNKARDQRLRRRREDQNAHGNICNRAADLLKKWHHHQRTLQGLDAVVEVAQRLMFVVTIFSGTLGTDAVTMNSASPRCGLILLQSHEITDELKDFVLSTGPFARVSMDEFGAETIDESTRQKLVAVGIWAQRCEPGRYMGTEFGDVVGSRMMARGHNPRHLRAKLRRRPCLAGAGRCQQRPKNTQRRASRIGARFLLEELAYTQLGYIVVDVTVGGSPAKGCKLSVVLKGTGAQSLGFLSALFKQSGKQRSAELRDAACKLAAA